MKKVMILAIAALLVAGVAGVSFAGIQGSAHDTGLTSPQGVCSNCHIPHKALGNRLWPSAAGTAASTGGVVGSLCYYCHGTGGLANALAVNTVFHTNSHPLHDCNVVTSTTVTGTGLPYPQADYECSSCHNPHQDQFSTTGTQIPAFLQRAPGTLCAMCHQNRQYVNAASSTAVGTWGDNNLGATNPGSHPVGTDVNGDSDATLNSDFAVQGGFEVGWDNNIQGTHYLGGHALQRASGGGGTVAAQGMGCVTCHAVHGANTQNDGESGSSAPGESLLVPAYTAGSLGGVGVGEADKFNFLCEACHGKSATNPASATGTADSNPGHSAYTHPVDQMTANNMGTVVIPNTGTTHTTNWPVGSTAGASMDVALICESCHLMHPNADGVTEGDHLTRAQNVCNSCHTSTPAGHHPIAAAMATGYADTNLGASAGGALSCYTCHGGGGGGAHNWTDNSLRGGIALNPAWRPSENGRGTDNVTTTTGKSNASLSQECVVCHTNDGTWPTARHNDPSPGPNTGRRAAEFQAMTASGTHWIGTNGGYGPAVAYDNGISPATTWPRPTTTWNALGANTTWPNGGWSRFIDTTGGISCESCHELEMDKNTGGTQALLLATFEEGQDIQRDVLCEGCHGARPVSGKTHPMTGDTVGRTGAALNTDTSTYAKATPDNNATYPATADRMNCDSCHQPHKATVRGLILEEGTGAVTYSAGKFSGFNSAPLCAACHDAYY